MCLKFQKKKTTRFSDLRNPPNGDKGVGVKIFREFNMAYHSKHNHEIQDNKHINKKITMYFSNFRNFWPFVIDVMGGRNFKIIFPYFSNRFGSEQEIREDTFKKYIKHV